jgi:hypothetical protein
MTFPPSFAKNWKTNAVGLISVAFSALQASAYHGDYVAAIKDRGVQMSLMLAVLGFVSKDFNVSGGTVGQPSTPQALKDSNTAPAKAPNAPEKPAA